MDKKNFSILYNGRHTDCVSMGDTFMVQISYKPLFLERKEDEAGGDQWLEQETGRETPLSKELGQLIRKQYLD